LIPSPESSSGDLLAAAQPALAEVGAAPGIDLAQPGSSHPTRLGRGPGARDDDVDLLVVDDDREPVVIVEPGDRRLDGLLGEADLLAAHRARAVEDEGEVDRAAGRAPPDGGATISARTKRLLLDVGRISCAVGANGKVMTGPPRGALGRSRSGARPAC
jgi:hypothetical protein